MSNGTGDPPSSPQFTGSPAVAPVAAGRRVPPSQDLPVRPRPWGELLAAILSEANESGESSQAEVMARRLVALATDGDKRAIDMVLEYVYGKPDSQPDYGPREPVGVVEIG